MINKTLSQKGSSHVVIIVALVLALVGTLGFVFWQNFAYKEPVAKEVEVIKTQDQPKDEYAGWKTGLFKYTKLSYKLPPNWQDVSDNKQFQDGYRYEEVKIRASDGFVLTMNVNDLPRGYENQPNNVVLEFKNIDSSRQWIIADNANGKVNRIYVGTGVTEVGEKILPVANVSRDGLNIELYGQYENELDSLATFNQKQSVKEAKLVFESLKFN